MKFETEKIEFKSKFTNEIYKEVIAFANTDGGFVYVGVDDDGNAIGLENVDEEYLRITNGIRDAILPDVTMFIKYSIQDNKVVKIEVNEGTNKPYYLQAKGLKASGVYVRQGSSSVQASHEQIRQMIKETDGDNFEEMRSLRQELTFEEMGRAFRLSNVEFSPAKYTALGMMHQTDGMYNNLALLLSDQCEHTIKVGLFDDEANTKFHDSQEFAGSIFKQYEEVLKYLELCNKTPSIVGVPYRVDLPEYPSGAIKEALLNALIHRDYSFGDSILIKINAKQMEFISLGGLLQGISIDDIKLGTSVLRNKNLAGVFHRLKLIESYGTGIQRIFDLYAGYERQPEIIVSPNVFKLILPNRNTYDPITNRPIVTMVAETCRYSAVPKEQSEVRRRVLPQGFTSHELEDDMGAQSEPPDLDGAVSAHAVQSEAIQYISPQKQEILNFLDKNGKITDAQVQELLNIKQTRCYVLMKEMKDEGFVNVYGRGETKFYARA